MSAARGQNENGDQFEQPCLCSKTSCYVSGGSGRCQFRLPARLTILDDARAWKADIVIMGRTGRTGPGRALLGSEAERVLEFTDRPVLIVPTLQGPTQQ